jgi:hypothetical protein
LAPSRRVDAEPATDLVQDHGVAAGGAGDREPAGERTEGDGRVFGGAVYLLRSPPALKQRVQRQVRADLVEVDLGRAEQCPGVVPGGELGETTGHVSLVRKNLVAAPRPVADER